MIRASLNHKEWVSYCGTSGTGGGWTRRPTSIDVFLLLWAESILLKSEEPAPVDYRRFCFLSLSSSLEIFDLKLLARFVSSSFNYSIIAFILSFFSLPSSIVLISSGYLEFWARSNMEVSPRIYILSDSALIFLRWSALAYLLAVSPSSSESMIAPAWLSSLSI